MFRGAADAEVIEKWSSGEVSQDLVCWSIRFPSRKERKSVGHNEQWRVAGQGMPGAAVCAPTFIRVEVQLSLFYDATLFSDFIPMKRQRPRQSLRTTASQEASATSLERCVHAHGQ